MSPDPITVAPQIPVSEARQLLAEHRFHHLPVVDSGRLVGIISDRDVAINPARFVPPCGATPPAT